MLRNPIFTNFGLQGRLSLVVSSVTFVGALIVFLLQASYDTETTLAKQKHELHEVSDLLSPILTEATINRDFSSVHSILDRQVDTRHNIYHIEWMFNNGISIIAQSPVELLTAPSWFHWIFNRPQADQVFHTPIDNRRTGEIRVKISTTPLINEIWDRFAFLMRAVFGALLLITATIFLFLRSNLRIANELAMASGRLMEGDYSYRVEEKGAKELCIAANAFNEMAARTETLLKDLSENKKELSRQLNFNTKLLESIPSPIYYLDKDGVFLGANSAWADFFNLDRKTCKGKTVTDIYSEFGDFATLMSNKTKLLINDHAQQSFDTTILNSNNEQYSILVLNTDFSHSNGEFAGIIGTIIDLTRLKLAEKETESALKDKIRAETANETKSQFLANMSHEMRTPLTAIIGLAETLIDEEQKTEDRMESVQTIIRSGKHLSQLINDLLDLSKVEAGKLELDTQYRSIPDMISEISALAQIQSSNKEISFKTNYHFPIPEKIKTDDLRLKQIIINLIGNAIKFTDKGSVSLEIEYSRSDASLLFSITDTGIGISEEQAQRLFAPFMQADISTTRKYGGTGLGLHLSKKLAKLLGGTLTLQSALGEGSCFTVTIPTNFEQNQNINWLNQLPDVPIAIQNTKTVHNKLAGRILLAEDIIDNQRLFRLLFKKVGLNIDIANNGKEAMQMATDKSYDLIFMDMQMPVMDGLEATRNIRSQGLDTTIVALTANVSEEDKQHYLQNGCSDFLAKPIDRNLFYQMLSKYLASDKGHTTPIISTLLEDDPDFRPIVIKFIHQLPGIIDDISKLYAQKNILELSNKIHSLKGLGGNIGYQILTDLSTEIEEKIKAGQLTEIASIIERIKETGILIERGEEYLVDETKEIPKKAIFGR